MQISIFSGQLIRKTNLRGTILTARKRKCVIFTKAEELTYSDWIMNEIIKLWIMNEIIKLLIMNEITKLWVIIKIIKLWMR